MAGELGRAPKVRTASTWNWSPLARAMRASEQAVVLDPESAEAHASRDHRDLFRLHFQPAEFGRDPPASLLRHEQQVPVGGGKGVLDARDAAELHRRPRHAGVPSSSRSAAPGSGWVMNRSPTRNAW